MRKTIFKKLEAQGLIANYNRLRKTLPPKLPERVYIQDETFREGIKTPTVFLTYVEQLKLAKFMDETGIAVINMGFPAFSEDDKRNIKRIVNETFQKTKLTASAQPSKSSVDACLECGVKHISMETPFNGLNLQYLLQTTKQQVLSKTVESIEYTQKRGAPVDFILKDGARTTIEDILEIFEAAATAGANKLCIADSVGFLRPLSMRYLMQHVRDGLKEATPKKETAFALPIQFHKAIIGENLFAHEVDEEEEKILAQPLLVEPFPPEIIGRETKLFIGRNTSQTLIHKLLERARIRDSPRQMDELLRQIKAPQESLDKGEAQMTYYQVKKLMKDLQQGLTLDEFWRLVEQITGQKPKLPEKEKQIPAEPN